MSARLRNPSRSKHALAILKKRTEEVSYPLVETEDYQDESKDIFNSILKEEVLSDSEPEEEES